MSRFSATAVAPAAAPVLAAADPASAVVAAARLLLPHLEVGRRIDAAVLRAAMESAFSASDADGAWDWKTAYDACEVATVLLIRRFGPAMRAKAGSDAAMLPMLGKVARLLPTHTRRSEESEALQQFSTPVALGYAASVAVAITPADVVLEPSAGTGLLAILAELPGASLVLNELADIRGGILDRLFPGLPVTRFDAAHIDDHLDAGVVPSVALMNPPFSEVAHVDRRMADAAFRHIASALARLPEGGRLVAITGASFASDNPAWTDAFVHLQKRARVVFSAAIDGTVFAKHGTTIDTRLTVIDRLPADDATSFPPSRCVAPDVGTLLGWIGERVPRRLPIAGTTAASAVQRPILPRTVRAYVNRAVTSSPSVTTPEAVELTYEPMTWSPAEDRELTDALYEEYGLQSIRIPGAQAHPRKLVQSAAMASVAPPVPSYHPHLPVNVVTEGLLSDAQIEYVIYAGEAHSDFLAGSWTIDETFDLVTAARDDDEDATRFRRGWFLGDGTGAGKGRQVAGVVLDNWLKGRRRAVWISKSDKLIEDAQRDWSALGMERLLVTPLSRFRQGTPIRLAEGILFTTYATLRSDARDEKPSRVRQIVDWLGADFDGVVVFDESHAMQNAAAGKGERGDVTASQQGRAGLRLQHAFPNARVLYVSATGATTVHNLAYAQRLGLWGGEDFPFATRAEFVEAIDAGGVAAMEVLARYLKALGLYAARSLSYEGVEYELVEHRLTDEQIRIYDAYAGAFSIIHNNLDAAMRAANVTGATGTLNAQAKSAARSAFESAKQRFFNHLITAMKTPTLISSIERDLKAGHAAVIQIVSTGEALMERRLAEIPTEEWGDVQVDITPREYVLDYLAHSFPTQLYEPFTDSGGTLSSRSVYRDGQPVQCRDAVGPRDRLIEKLASLPPVHGALNQIVQRFGADMVAEVTGRSRIVRKTGSDRIGRLVVENRAGSANLAETQAFMDDVKRILVFSDAGGTGRSYHAELSARNRRLRTTLSIGGWMEGRRRDPGPRPHQPHQSGATAAVPADRHECEGREAVPLDHRSQVGHPRRHHQGPAPDRRPGPVPRRRQPRESLCTRRVAPALSPAGHGQGRWLFASGVRGRDRPEVDRRERYQGRPAADHDMAQPHAGADHRPTDVLFTAFEQLLTARIEGAIASGSYDVGLETLTAESFTVTDRQTIYAHPGTAAETRLHTITQRQRNQPVTLDEALKHRSDPRAVFLVNTQSGRAAVQVPARSVMLDDGQVERRVRLVRPIEHPVMALASMPQTHWREADRANFARAWSAELADVPEFTDNENHIVAGLLLPIWKRLPNESTRVYRLQTDTGERIIGRKVSADWVASATAIGISALTPEAAFAALLDGRTILDLAENLQFRRVRVMGVNRIELTGFTDAMRERLSAYGPFHEIISWKLRMFVPTDGAGVEVLTRVLDRYPVAHISERAA